MRAWLARFMMGRYGSDDLSRFLSILVLVLAVVSMFTQWTALYWLAMALLIYNFFRMFSRNTAKRGQENYAFLRIKNRFLSFFKRFKTRFTESKTHRFYQCPSCRQELRVPKGKGRIRVRCPKCGTAFEKKT